MENLAIRRYAVALFELAKEKGQPEVYNQAAKDILEILKENKEFLAILNHVSISTQEKIETMKAVFAGKIPEDFLGVFELLFKRGRQKDLTKVLSRFEQLYKEHMGIVVATIYSPVELPLEKQEEIAQMLGKRLGKTIEFDKVIDKSLLGGFRVEVCGFTYDASLKEQLSQLKKELLSSARHKALPELD
ncbi:MAG: ATP synthase F1 subunit delta [Defluviitaleaceae bacterium]|nr:ATP synthase F1 subunit delta [Defluviitaleaceae bacterium]